MDSLGNKPTMALRSNACRELTRFWLEERHGCLVRESLPIKVPEGNSDIDLIALRPDLTPFTLPDGTQVGPRLIVETKDEHDWEPRGIEFGACLRADAVQMNGGTTVAIGAPGIKFTMLCQEQYNRARQVFGSDDFDRLFVVHALDPNVHQELRSSFARHRIYWTTVPIVVSDILTWYAVNPTESALRNALTGDLIHLLVGFCGLRGSTT
jgi:hypothetical protein